MSEEINTSLLKANAKKFIKQGRPKPMMVVLVAVLISMLVFLLQALVQCGGFSGLMALIEYRLGKELTPGQATRLYMALINPGGRVISMLLNVVDYIVSAGLIMYYMQQVRTRNGGYGSLLDSFPQILRIIGYEIITRIMVMLWSLLFIIPGIIAVYRYSQGLYILLDHPEYGIMDCISESKRMMDGKKGDLFLLQLSFIGWGMLLAAVMVAATFLTSLILTIFEVSSVALGGFLLSVIPILLTLPLSIFLVAYQGFTFFQYYDALQGRYHDPDQPPAAKEPPEEPKTEDYRWY